MSFLSKSATLDSYMSASCDLSGMLIVRIVTIQSCRNLVEESFQLCLFEVFDSSTMS